MRMLPFSLPVGQVTLLLHSAVLCFTGFPHLPVLPDLLPSLQVYAELESPDTTAEQARHAWVAACGCCLSYRALLLSAHSTVSCSASAGRSTHHGSFCSAARP